MKLKEKISQFYKKHTKAFNIIENILIVLLVLIAYALGFSNGVKECTNNQNNSQIEEKTSSRRNSNTQLYGMVADDEYYTTIHQTNLFQFEDPDIENFEVDFAYGTLDELYVDEILTEPTIDSYIAIGFTYDPYDYQVNHTEDVSLSFNLSNYNNDSINNLDDDKYYYVYSALEIIPMNNHYSSPDYYMVNHRFISSDYQDLYYENSYINPIFKGSSLKATLEYLFISFDLFFTNRFDYTSFYIRLNLSVFDLSDFTNINYDKGYDDGYDVGYSDSLNGVMNIFDSTKLDGVVYENGSPDPIISDDISFVDNYNFTNYVNELNDYYYNEGLTDEYNLISIYGFTPFLAKTLSIKVRGFSKVVINYDGGYADTYEFNNYNDFNFINDDSNNKIIGINLYFIPLEQSINSYTINFEFIDRVDLAYKDGYSSGVDNVVKNPNNYDLYNQNQVDEIENNSYSDGYTSGLDYVLTNPNEFFLYTSLQLQEAVQQALQETDKTLSNVWTIIRNAASAVAEVMSIQIMPGISLATLVGIFVGIPLLLWAIKILAS